MRTNQVSSSNQSRLAIKMISRRDGTWMMIRRIVGRMRTMKMRMRRMMLTSFCEVDSLSKMEGKAPMTRPSRAVFVAIFQLFSGRLEEHTKSASCLLEGWRENESPCSDVFRFL